MGVASLQEGLAAVIAAIETRSKAGVVIGSPTPDQSR